MMMISLKKMHLRKHMLSSQMQLCTRSDQSIFYILSTSPSTLLHSHHFRQSIVIHANGYNTSLLVYLLSFSWDLYHSRSSIYTLVLEHTRANLFILDIRFMYKSETEKEYIGIIHSYGLYRHISYDEKFIFLFI